MNISKIIFGVVILISGCVEKNNTHTLEGTWQGKLQTGTQVTLNFFKQNLKVITSKNGTSGSNQWQYSLSNDTLILINKNRDVTKHIISKLTDSNLRLVPEIPNQVDIAIIDAIEFSKKE